MTVLFDILFYIILLLKVQFKPGTDGCWLVYDTTPSGFVVVLCST